MGKAIRNHMQIVLIVIIAMILLTMPSDLVQAKTYKEGKVYTVTGRLIKRTYNHGGNGLKITGYMLVLGKKITISSARYGSFKGKEIDINANSLSMKSYSMLTKLVGKRVKVKGYFMIPDSLWWWYNRGVVVASRVTKK